MRPLSCVATRRRMTAYQDGELPIAEQLGVEAHLRQCDGCAAELADRREVGAALRARAAAAAAWRSPALECVEDDVMSRLSAEREDSLSSRAARAFQDMRLSLAALGSASATIVSALLLVGIFHYAPLSARSDSLAGMMDTLAAPAIGMDSRVLSPPTGKGDISEGLVSEEDAVFALAAVVTRNGRIASLEYLSDQSSNSDRARAIRLLDEVSRARFEPARLGGNAVSVRTVLVLAHTTVRAKMPVTPKQSAAPRGPELVRG